MASPPDLYVRESGAGMPLVLLHAFPLSSAMWIAQREALASRCRVITPDQRGFGGSPLGEDPPSLDVVADDVARLLDDRSIDRAVVGGLSMGGYAAMAFVRRHPDRLAGLVLADTKAAADPPATRDTRERIAGAVEDDPQSTVLLDEVLPTLVGRTTLTERVAVYGRVKALVQAAPAAAVAWAERAMAGRPDSVADLAALTVPLLVVVGEEDELSPPTDAEAMAAAAPDARLVRIPGAGHLCAVECPEAFTGAVADFLSRLTTG